MKFIFEYRSSDNVRHIDVVAASSRDAAYAALKSQGIRPVRLAVAPGFFNRLLGFGKRGLVIVVLTLMMCFSLFFAYRARRDMHVVDNVLDSETRRQIIGDAEVIDRGIRTGWSDVFVAEGDRFLASFAIPGVHSVKRTATEASIRDALSANVLVADKDSIEVRQIKSIVAGMKKELAKFLSDGGTIRQYSRRLVLRQNQELSYYLAAKSDLEQAVEQGKSPRDIEMLVESRNKSLRKIGLKLLVVPE